MTHRESSKISPALLALLITGAACSADGGTRPDSLRSVHVSVTTEGEDVDADGYTVTLGSDSRTVIATGSVTFSDLAPGSYEVTLSGLAPNCAADGEVRRSVTVSEGGDANVSFDVTCLFDAAGETLEEMSCPGLAPAVGEGTPLDGVSLAGVPSSLERPVWARMSWDGGPLVSQGLVTEQEGGEVTLRIPLHPSGSAEGGDVTVRISDEDRTCAPFPFRIQPLPAAPGELTGLADVAQDLLDQHSVLFGTTREELLGTPLPEMEPALVPLAVAHAIVDGASDESLRSYAEGAAPDFTAGDLDLLERIVARTGLRADLEAELAAVLADGAAFAPAEPPLRGASRAPSPGVALACVTATALDAALLDECMTLARDKAQGAASAETQELAINAMEAAALLGSRKIAKPIASLLTFSKLYDQAVAGVLPSSFVSIDVTAKPPEFMEDQAGPGTWAPANVTATSIGWNLEALTTELIAGRISPGSGLPNAVPRLTFRQKTGLKYAYPEVASALSTAGDIENFFLGFREGLVKALVGLGVTEFSDGSLAIAPRPFGPVDVTDTEWSDARIVTGTSVVLTPHEEYDPREPGRSLLEIVTAVGKFGGTSIRTEHLPIDVREISLQFTRDGSAPDEIYVRPSQTLQLELVVENAQHADSVEIDPVPAAQGSASLTKRGAGPGRVTHDVTYTAPQDLAALPLVLTARHTGTTGARRDSSEPRVEMLTIRPQAIQILPMGACLEPGGTEQFTAELLGVDDSAVIWSATLGSISSTGLYTAPTDAAPGTLVTITATSAEVEDLEASVGITVGCVCSFSVRVGGSTYASVPGDRIDYMADAGRQEGIITVQLTSAASGDDVLFAMGGEPIVPGTYEVANVGGTLAYDGSEVGYSNFPDDAISFELLRYTPHTLMTGGVTGIVRDGIEGVDGTPLDLSAVFTVVPDGSTFLGYYCEVPEP